LFFSCSFAKPVKLLVNLNLENPFCRYYLERICGILKSVTIEAIWKAFAPLYGVIFGICLVILALAYLKRFTKYLIRRHSELPTLEKFGLMSGVEFELALRQLFEKKGWKVQLTSRSGDFGADLVMRREGKVVVVQAKRWAKPIGLKAVQEITAARDFYKADEAWVVTTSTFTQAAIKQAKASKVRLQDRTSLKKFLSEA